MSMRRAFASALVGLALAFHLTSASAADKLRIAVPQRGAWDTGLTELASRGGIFKKHDLDVDILYTQAGPESIQALIAGSVDIATGTGVGSAIGTIAKGAPIRIISSEILGAPDQYWYVRSDSPVRTIADLNGRSIAFSLTGSSSHAALMALADQYKLVIKPVSTGSITATLTQALTGQVDVGFSAVPFFLDKVDAGEIRIVATGNDVDVLRTRTGRVNLTNLPTLQNRRPALVRFHAAYKEAIEWMYSDDRALTLFAEFSGLPASVVGKVRSLLPKQTMAPDEIVGIDQILREALAAKFISAPLTEKDVLKMVDVPLK